MAFARLWHARGKERGMVLIVHDVAEHSQRYQNFALFLTHHGYSVVAYDLRGHGFSALNSASRDDQISLKKYLYGNTDFGYMPAKNGWFVYLDDLSNVLKYVFSRYSVQRNFLFGHGMGSMILSSVFSVLSRNLLKPLTGVLLSAPFQVAGMKDKLTRVKINAQIKKYGDAKISSKTDEAIFGQYSQSDRFLSLRTEQDWISSQPEEVDQYIADPLCGNVLRLGLYHTILEGKRFVYSGRNRQGMGGRSFPVFIFSGEDDPASAYGKAAGQLSDLFRKCGWQNVEIRRYAGRHDLLHDRTRADVYGDCLAWIEAQR